MIGTPALTKEGNPIIDQSSGDPVMVYESRPGTIIDALDLLLQDFPRNQLNMKSIMESSKLWALISDARERQATEIQLEDAHYEWLIEVLKNDRIGVPMFGLNLLPVLTALGNE